MYQLFVIIESDIYSISTKYQVDRPGIEKIDLRLLHHCQKRLAKILRFLLSHTMRDLTSSPTKKKTKLHHVMIIERPVQANITRGGQEKPP